MKLIPLSKGKHAIVDDEDFDRISQFKWHYHPYGYAARKPGKVSIYLHHEVMGKKVRIDHANGDRLDCRKENMREATAQQNAANRRPTSKKWRFKGVRMKQGTWHAEITYNRKYYFLGAYQEEADAALAYNVAAQLCFGEFAHLNDV